MAPNPNLVLDTLASMEAGDCLVIMGGTFPGLGETAEVHLGLRMIIPCMNFICNDSNHPPRKNPLSSEEDEDPQPVDLVRNDKKFGHDYDDGPQIEYGKRAGLILGQIVDLWVSSPLTSSVLYFVGKPGQ